MRNPIFNEILDKCKELHERKSHDYAQDDNVFSNFEYAGELARAFSSSTDRAFAVLVGVKLARLAELRKGKEPKNESIEDTIMDLVNYTAIWGSFVIKELNDSKGEVGVKENRCSCTGITECFNCLTKTKY